MKKISWLTNTGYSCVSPCRAYCSRFSEVDLLKLHSPFVLSNFVTFLLVRNIVTLDHILSSKTCIFLQYFSKTKSVVAPTLQPNFEISATLEFSLNGAELSLNSTNSENLRNHWGMNWVQYNDLLCYLCLCGLVVSSPSLTQEILGSNPTMLIFYFFCHWIQRIQWKHLEKTPLWRFLLTWENNATIQRKRKLQISKLLPTITSFVFKEKLFFRRQKTPKT